MDNQLKILVLIVDDETEHQKNFSRWLQRSDMDVLTANDGLNALGVLTKYGIEGAVYIMPGKAKPVNFTERSDLFIDIINRFSAGSEIPQNGVYHKKGYSVVVSDSIISLGIGYPSDKFKKQILGEIIEQAHEQFEQYMRTKGTS